MNFLVQNLETVAIEMGRMQSALLFAAPTSISKPAVVPAILGPQVVALP